MVDYSKWDHIDLSDDDSDLHPNIDRDSWLRWKKQSKELKKKEEEERRKIEDEERAAKAKLAEEVKAKLKIAKDEEEKKRLEEEAKKAEERVKELQRKREKEEEFLRKHPQWDDDNICREGFSKTIVNSSTKKEEEEEKKLEEKLKALSEEEKKRLEEEEEKKMNEYVREMEIKAHKFVACNTFEEYKDVLFQHPEIVSPQTHEYLLLHSSDCIKKGNDNHGRRYLRAAAIISYCVELGKQGVMIFFKRMMDPNPTYRNEFEKDQEAYWQRCKEKILELQEQRQKRKEQGLPEDEEEDTSDKVD